MTRIYLPLMAVLSCLTAGCQPISGKFTVDRQLMMELTETERPVTPGCLPRDGDCNEPLVRKVSGFFYPGSYEARLDMDAPDAIQLVIDPGTRGPAVVRVAIPEGYHLPKSDGRFTLAAKNTGQTFDTKGVVQTTEAVSPVRSGFEGCQIHVKRRVCEFAGGHKKNDAVRRPCHLVHDSVYGQRAVEFHQEYRTRKVTLEFFDDSDGEHLARFSGSATRTTKVYDYRGYCFADHTIAHQVYW